MIYHLIFDRTARHSNNFSVSFLFDRAGGLRNWKFPPKNAKRKKMKEKEHCQIICPFFFYNYGFARHYVCFCFFFEKLAGPIRKLRIVMAHQDLF